MLTNLKNFITKFKKWIIIAIFGSTALAGGLSGIPQDLYNNLNVKVYSVCDLQSAKRTSIADDLTNFKAKNPDNSLRGLNAGERAGFKSCEISKRGNEFAGIYNSVQYGTSIEIISEVKAIIINSQHGIELFARAWKNGQPLGFGKDGSVEIERFRIFNPPILVDDPNGTIIRESINPDTGQTVQRKLREDPLEAIRQVISHNAKIVGIENAPIVVGKVGNTTDTFYSNTGGDGRVLRTAAGTWSAVRDGNGDTSLSNETSQNAAYVGTTATTDQFELIGRGFFPFDTSALPDDDTVSSATFSLVGFQKQDDLSLSLSVGLATTASFTALQTSDYQTTRDNTTKYATDITLASFVVDSSTYNDWTLNSSGLSAISKTSFTGLSLRINSDIENSAPTWSASKNSRAWVFFADQAGTTQDPKLVVVHSASAATRGEEFTNIFE